MVLESDKEENIGYIIVMKHMNKSGEDYLEAILNIESEQGFVRITDIAQRLEVSKPSVNRAMKVLREDGYVNHETYGQITLTEKGKVHAAMVYKRHTTLVKFLRDVLHVSEEVSERDACLIEHDVSSETMEKITSFLENYLEEDKKEV